jgi:hypothetical protein
VYSTTIIRKYGNEITYVSYCCCKCKKRVNSDDSFIPLLNKKFSSFNFRSSLTIKMKRKIEIDESKDGDDNPPNNKSNPSFPPVSTSNKSVIKIQHKIQFKIRLKKL